MNTCQTCQQSTLEGAAFCHHCGTSVGDSDCLQCGYHNPSGWKKCENCGQAPGSMNQASTELPKNFVINFNEIPRLQPQIENYFYAFFNHKISAEFGTANLGNYTQLFRSTDYPEEVNEVTAELAEKVYTIHCKQHKKMQREIDELLNFTFSSVINEFLVSYKVEEITTTQTQPTAIPEPTPAPDADRPVEVGQPTDRLLNQSKVLEFFDVAKHPDKIYTDLNRLPSRKLDEFKKQFLFNSPGENVLLVYDDTVFGTGSTGFALTEQGIYWKSHFKNAQRVYFADIHHMELENNVLLINEIPFGIEPEMDKKVFDWLNVIRDSDTAQGA